MILTLSLDTLNIMTWWVDASYAVHNDMNGHTRGTMSLGQGLVYSSSSEQNLVSQSSSEAELIGVYDVMPQLIWTGNFKLAQGIDIKKVVLMQDNTSTILLSHNGQSSSSKWTKNIDIQYFYIKEKVDSKDVVIEYCPTEMMTANYFTKLLQGNLFKCFQTLIMRSDPSSKYCVDPRSVLSHEENHGPTQTQGQNENKTQLSMK